jgi:hypothetical protein
MHRAAAVVGLIHRIIPTERRLVVLSRLAAIVLVAFGID